MPPWWWRHIDKPQEGHMSENTPESTTEQHEEPETQEVAENAEGTEPEVEETEEAFDKDRALAKIKKVNSENRALRQRATDAEAKAKASEGSDERAKTLGAENLRLRVALKLSLPESLAARLRGDTEEELLQDAEELMGMFASKTPPTNQPRERLRGGGDPTSEPDGLEDTDKFAERMFRNRH